MPCRVGSSSHSFALAKCPLPKKPRCALSGEGCGDLSSSTFGVFCVSPSERTYLGHSCFSQGLRCWQAPSKEDDTLARTAIHGGVPLAREHRRQWSTAAARGRPKHDFKDLSRKWFPAPIVMRSCCTRIHSLLSALSTHQAGVEHKHALARPSVETPLGKLVIRTHARDAGSRETRTGALCRCSAGSPAPPCPSALRTSGRMPVPAGGRGPGPQSPL